MIGRWGLGCSVPCSGYPQTPKLLDSLHSHAPEGWKSWPRGGRPGRRWWPPPGLRGFRGLGPRGFRV